MELVYVQGLGNQEAAYRAGGRVNDVNTTVAYIRRVLRDRHGRTDIKVSNVDVIISDGAAVNRPPTNVDPTMWIAPEHAVKVTQAEFDVALSEISDPMTRIAVRLRIGERWTIEAIANTLHVDVAEAQRITRNGTTQLRAGLDKDYSMPRELLIVP